MPPLRPTTLAATLVLAGAIFGACADSSAPEGPPSDGAAQGSGGRSGAAGGANAGAGGASAGGAAGAGGAGAGGGASIVMRVSPGASAASTGGRIAAFGAGQTTATSLESLKYYVSAVTICESLEVMGTGFSNPTGCLELYRRDLGRLSYLPTEADFTRLADAAREGDDGFVDLMNPASRAVLSGGTPLGPEAIRKYHYGIITWALPVKVKASVPLFDGRTLFTHDGATERRVMSGATWAWYPTVSPAPFTEGVAEEAVVLLGNGGNWFKFQNPLWVSAEDVASGRGYVLDLVFNPEGLVKGFAGGTRPPELEDGAEPRNSFRVPMLDLAPVPHRAAERVVKETYVAPVGEGAGAFEVRLEIYAIAGDPNHTVYGVDAKTLAVASSASDNFSDFNKIAFVEQGAAPGALDLQIWDRRPVVSGFARGAAVGDAAPATLDCVGDGPNDRNGAFGVQFSGCVDGHADVTFTLRAVTEL